MLPLKVAHTRLENRQWRDGQDLVEDAPQEGLRQEVSHLRTSRDCLRKNLEKSWLVISLRAYFPKFLSLI